MASLSTIYGVTIVLGSLVAMGAAFLGNYITPIQSGGSVIVPPPLQPPVPPVENTVQTLPVNPSVVSQ
jgi:hypothetical protein